MTEAGCPPVEVSRRIAAPAAAIFAVLAEPAMHPVIDGSAMLRGAAAGPPATGVGDVFTVDMYFHALGRYRMDNHVVEFEPDRRIAWEPVAGEGHPAAGGRLGHRWEYVLTPEGPTTTVVTERYDCAAAPAEFRAAMENGEQWRPGMEATLARLEEVVRDRVAET